MSEICEYHTQLISDIAVIKERQENISKSQDRIEKFFAKHVEEAERPTGFRDRLLKLEIQVSDFKKRFWMSSLVGGIIGALIGSGSGEALTLLIKWMIGK